MKKKVIIKPGCIGCGLCEALAPRVFKVNNVSRVRDDADVSKYEQEVEEAVKSCPVKVMFMRKKRNKICR